jgi:CRISPR-associated endonuclease Csn1
MKKILDKDYYLGLDIGTDSVGWAVTDENYNILKTNGKMMWGTRRFDTAETAEQRRNFRSARRRLERRKQRIRLLQELFSEEINKVDPGFFQRLKDSPLHKEDKKAPQRHSFFADEDYTDAHYFMEYPTIYHLRKALLEGGREFDIRLVYLALHHIIKRRGHFIFEGNDISVITSFKKTFSNFVKCIYDELDIELDCSSTEEVEEIIKNKKMSRSDKRKKLISLFHIDKADTQSIAILSLISGLKANLSDLFDDETLSETEKPSISFSEGSFDEIKPVLEDILQERFIVVESIKTVYDWAVLAEVLEDGELDGKVFLSVAKVNKYNKHRDDLRLLKNIIREYFDISQYKEIFNSGTANNYCSYVGFMKKNGRKISLKQCDKSDFYKYILKVLSKINVKDERIDLVKEDIQKETFLPLQVVTDNSVIPHQVHKIELIQILNNVSSYYPFLNKVDEDGITVKDKIINIFEFRIPYYVGPINTSHGKNSWAVRKEAGIVRPWNFTEKIDIDASAERFRRRMTNKCTYLNNCNVIPKYSLLYSEYMVLNELNNVRIGQDKLPLVLKQKIYRELFQRNKHVTRKKLYDFIRAEGYEIGMDDLSGLDNKFNAALISFNDFRNKKLFGERIKEYKTQIIIEDIILWITLYGEDKNMLRRVIRKNYTEEKISDTQIKEICKLSYSGWGRFSKEFLQDIIGINRTTGECMSIIQALRNTNDNLMQLLSSKYTFTESIEEENNNNLSSVAELTYESLVKDIVASPSIKRAIWQTILITEEVCKLAKKMPAKIFVEMARGSEEKKRTVSRKDNLIKLYENCKEEERAWKEELEKTPESDFRSIKLYLYYTQMGKCMYSGRSIELSELTNANVYDRDHIYPQSKTKDDSLDNLVLVDKRINARKGDGLISGEIQEKMEPYWWMLRSRGFINRDKYERLTRKTPLTDEELAGFINRQLVETRQSSKIVASILSRIYKDSKVVYVKAKSVVDFRQENLEMVKIRELNDFHHARDAYLNIVVGNVYHEKFTSNPLKWLKANPSARYNLKKMFDKDIYNGNKVAWRKGKNGTIALVRKMVRKNSILVTNHATCNKGELFNAQAITKDKNPTVPIKAGMDVKKYGGYGTIRPAYFILVESTDKKGKKQRTIESVPLYLVKKFEEEPNLLIEYCRTEYKLKEPRIIISKIKKNAYMKINGFPMNLRGTTGEGQLVMQGAVQLCINEEDEKYLKKVINYLARNAERKDKKVNLPISRYDGISLEENLRLYDTFLNKLKNSIYKYRPANQASTMEKGRNIFLKLTLEEQSIVLGEILKLFQCNPITADLRLIGGSKSAGSTKINSKISDYETAKLIHQSPTGIFEQEVDLLTV